MDDVGFSGISNQFANRFQAGAPISASQLNDLISGISTALPQPYTGDGPSVSHTPGGSNILSADNSITRNIVQQFQTRVIHTATGFGVQVAKGRVLFQNAESIGTPGNIGTFECNVVGFYCYPTGKLTTGTGTAPTPWVNNGGYVNISPGP